MTYTATVLQVKEECLALSSSLDDRHNAVRAPPIGWLDFREEVGGNVMMHSGSMYHTSL